MPESPRVLFAGSSSLYFHDLPLALARWLADAGQPIEPHLVGRSGDGIHHYRRPGFDRYQYGVTPGQTFLDKVRDERFDALVLHAVAAFIVGPEGDEHADAIAAYCDAARDAGGVPVLYEMGWGRDDATARGRDRIADAARQADAALVPCATAWARVYRERPDLALQDPPDTVHPGRLGHYLNACTFFAAFAGQRPDAPPPLPIWRKVQPEAEAAADDALRTARPTLDPYVAALPAFMQRMSVLARPEPPDPDTAAYFRAVAWDAWQALGQPAILERIARSGDVPARA